MSTLTQMGTQREQMQFASDNMNDTVNATAQARRILKQMYVAFIVRYYVAIVLLSSQHVN
jgi:hypothetical protein